MQSRYFWPHHTVNITAIFQCIMLLIQWTLSMLNTGRYPLCRLGAFYVESDVLWSKLKSLDEILWCGHSKETSSAVLSHGTIFLVCSSNFWVCEWNPAVRSLQTKPLHPCFPIVLLFFFNKNLWCDHLQENFFCRKFTQTCTVEPRSTDTRLQQALVYNG